FSRNLPAVFGVTQKLAVLHHDLAAQYGDHRPGGHVVTFPRAVVGLVHVFVFEFALHGGIEDRDIGIAADRYGPFARIQSHDPGGIRRNDIDKALERLPAFGDDFRIHDAHARFAADIAARGIV